MKNPRRPFIVTRSDGHYWGYCDRCAFKVRNDHLKVEWTGLLVCDETVNGCYEARNEQDFVRGVPDRQSVFPARPYDTGNTTVDDTVLGYTEARCGLAHCNSSRCGSFYPS